MFQRAGLIVAAVAVLAAQPARPQDDLFHYANGEWLRTALIPADRVTYGTFDELADRTEAELKAIVDDVIGGRVRLPDPIRRQIADLYTSATDEARIERLGAAPLQPELARIDAIASATALAAEAGRLSSIGVGGPFDGSTGEDPQHPGVPIVRIVPGGTLLPDLRYYADPAFADVRDRYESYLRLVFELTARNAPAGAARDVLALETALARAQWSSAAATRADLSDRRFTLRELTAAMPGFDWTAWARPQGLDKVPALVLARPPFFGAFAALVPNVPLRTWQNWLVARYVTAAAPFLSRPFDMARFEFFGALLTGQEQPRLRWKRGVSMVSAYLGDAVGRLYVERHFSSAARSKARVLVDNVVAAYRDAVHETAAMTPAAKREALARLAAMRTEVGYPSDWHEYRELVVRSDDLFGNWLRALAFEAADRTRAVTGADRTWARPPQTVNAYYAASTNAIVVPAALLQPPIFDADADAAWNYGAAGALVGHEVAHALGASEDGADAAGLAVAFRAYRRSLNGQPSPRIDGTGGEQRFFLAWARMWRSKERVAYLDSIELGAYRPGSVRANAAVAAVEGFYSTFGVKPEDRLFRPPAERIGIR